MQTYDNSLLKKASRIKLCICDVDGVLTDGRLIYTENGLVQKSFHVHDGLGLQCLQRVGITVAILSAKESNLVSQRMQELDITYVFQGQSNKLPVFCDLVSQLNLQFNQVAVIGDDLPDLPLIERAGLGVTVPHADPMLQQQADWITPRAGGHGAVRDLCHLILEAQNYWASIYEDYL